MLSFSLKVPSYFEQLIFLLIGSVCLQVLFLEANTYYTVKVECKKVQDTHGIYLYIWYLKGIYLAHKYLLPEDFMKE